MNMGKKSGDQALEQIYIQMSEMWRGRSQEAKPEKWELKKRVWKDGIIKVQ